MNERLKSMGVSNPTFDFFLQNDVKKSFLETFEDIESIDIMAMTPSILAKERELLKKAMKNGAKINFLLSSVSTALLWSNHQADFAGKFDQIATFVKELQNDFCDLFAMRICFWSPSVGLIMVNRRHQNAEAFIAMYTPDPKAPSGDKVCFVIRGTENRTLLDHFSHQFLSLWYQSEIFDLKENPQNLFHDYFEKKVRQSLWEIKGFKKKDIGVVIALQEEMNCFLNIINEYKIEPDVVTGQIYYCFTIGEFQCVATLVGKMGRAPAVQNVERLLAKYTVGTICSIGIAGSVKPDDIKIGDVVVASQVTDFLHRSKVTGTDKSQMVVGGAGFQTTAGLVYWIQQFHFTHNAAFKNWKEKCDTKAADNLRSFGDTLSPLAKCLMSVHLHSDDVHIASSDFVIGSEHFAATTIAGSDRNISVVEMEASGVVQGAVWSLARTRTLVIRGISDYSNAQKSTDETSLGNLNRAIAMSNATFLLTDLLTHQIIPKGSQVVPGWMSAPSG